MSRQVKLSSVATSLREALEEALGESEVETDVNYDDGTVSVLVPRKLDEEGRRNVEDAVHDVGAVYVETNDDATDSTSFEVGFAERTDEAEGKDDRMAKRGDGEKNHEVKGKPEVTKVRTTQSHVEVEYYDGSKETYKRDDARAKEIQRKWMMGESGDVTDYEKEESSSKDVALGMIRDVIESAEDAGERKVLAAARRCLKEVEAGRSCDPKDWRKVKDFWEELNDSKNDEDEDRSVLETSVSDKMKDRLKAELTEKVVAALSEDDGGEHGDAGPYADEVYDAVEDVLGDDFNVDVDVHGMSLKVYLDGEATDENWKKLKGKFQQIAGSVEGPKEDDGETCYVLKFDGGEKKGG